MCSFLACSKKVETAIGLGVAVVFVQTLTVPLNHLLLRYLLGEGALAWLGEYVAHVRPLIVKGDDPGILFLSRFGRRLDKSKDDKNVTSMA